MTKATQLTVRLDEELAEKIEEECSSTPYKVPKAEVVRAALKEHLSC